MRHVLLYQIWNATESIWTDKTRRDRHVSWDNLTMRTLSVTIGNDRKPMVLHWGFRLKFVFSNDVYLNAITRPEPIFADGDVDRLQPIMYDQSFEGNITLRYICDDSLESGEIVFDSYLWPVADGSAFLVKCGQSKYFPNENRTSNEPRMVAMNPDMLTW
jgi:hypothetical protein